MGPELWIPVSSDTLNHKPAALSHRPVPHLSGHSRFGGSGTLSRGSTSLSPAGISPSDSNKDSALEEEEEDDEEDEEEDDDSEVKEENGVLVLGDANFDSFVADKDTVLLEFYAPW